MKQLRWLSGLLLGLTVAVVAADRPPLTKLEPPEKDFFTKQLLYHGLPIKAPAVVVDDALYAAHDRLELMLRHLPGVTKQLVAAGVELHIIGRDQVTTDLPEWRHDKGKPLAEYNGQTRDERTRGMGGKLVSCGEENLLKLDQDRYRGRDICLHEFAHAVRTYGQSKKVRAQFDEQLKRSLAAGRWRGAYAGTNAHEFFAELTMWYFGTHGDLGMSGLKPANGPAGLKHYDPEAFGLFDAFYKGRLHEAEHPLAELRQRLEAAVNARVDRVVIPPGVYRGTPEKGGKIHIAIRQAANLEIIAEGVTLLCAQPTRALDLADCTNVTLRGLTVDYDPLPFTQGDIVALDPAAGWLDVQIHTGYPVEPYTRVDIVDRQTRYRKRDKPFMWDSSAAVRSGGVVRVQNKAAAGFAQVGDFASLGGFPPGVIAHAVTISDSARITLDRVTIHAANCMGVVASGGAGAHEFRGCRIVPGPPPPGATEARILSVNADAILNGPMRQGVLTEGCEIRDAGDDTWSVQSADYVILKREGQTLWLAPRDAAAVQTGDRLQAALAGPVAKVVACEKVRRAGVALAPELEQKLNAAASWSFWKLRDDLHKVIIEGAVPWQAGDSVYDVDRQGNGFIFRNNTVRSSGRILVKASGLIESNRIEGPFAVSANPELPCPAAAGIAALVIRHNTIRDAHQFNPHYSSPQAGAISVTAEDGGKNTMRPAGVFGQVVIEGNTISGGNGAGIVVSSAREVSLRDNRLENLLHLPPNCTGAKYRIDNHAAVWLAECDRVTLAGNKLLNPGSEMSRPLVRGENVKQLDGDLLVVQGLEK